MATLDDIDLISQLSISSLNQGFIKHLEDGGFGAMDNISKQIFPSVFSAINNCLCKPLQKHPLYKNIELIWGGSTAEGVNIPNFDRTASGKPQLDFEMDILCVLRDIQVGRTMDSPVILVQQEGTSKGYFLLYINDQEYRERLKRFCLVPSNPKRKGEMYLNPLLLVEDFYKQIEHIFGQIPLLKEKFRLEFNPPAVTMTMSQDFTNSGDGTPPITVSIDIVMAIEIPPSCIPTEYPSWVQVNGKPKWLTEESFQRIQQEPYYLVGKNSPKGHPQIEWRLSFNRLELSLMQEIKMQFPWAIICYRMFKMIRFWHFKSPDFLHSYHLKMLFLKACHTLPETTWTEDNVARHVLGLLDSLFHCLALQSLPSYFIPYCNLIEGVHNDFILTLLNKVSQVRKNPMENMIDLKR